MNENNNKTYKYKVSVIVPVYNSELFINDCISSIRNQTLSNIQIILVDDGSTDNTLKLLKKYEAEDSRILVLEQENINAGAARNHGLEYAEGEYICFFDADDCCKPEMLKTLVDAAEDKCADLVICEAESMKVGKHTGDHIGWAINWNEMPILEDGCYNSSMCPNTIFQTVIMSPWNKMFKASLIFDNNIKAQSQASANDVLLTTLALAHARKIYPVRESLYIQRRRLKSSITGNLLTEKKILCGYSASHQLMVELKARGLYEKLKVSFKVLSLHNCMWYLQKSRSVFSKEQEVSDENYKLYRYQYEFIKNEGLNNLDIDQLDEFVLARSLKMDVDLYRYVKSNDFADEMLYCLKMSNKKLDSITGKYNKLKKSFLVRLNRKRRSFLARFKAKKRIKQERKAWEEHLIQATNARRTNDSQKSYCIMAFERFHYNVVIDYVRLCNPAVNHVEVFTRKECRDALEVSLGELSSKIIWAVYDDHSDTIKNKKEKSTTLEGRRTLLSELVAKKNNYDKVILVSPEYYPDWYEPVTADHDYNLVMTLHNLNSILCPQNGISLKSHDFFMKADSYAVIDESIVDGILNRDDSTRDIYVLPPVFNNKIKTDDNSDKDRICFTITGEVSEKRKNYTEVVDALEMCPELLPKIRLTLLGRASSEYAISILERLNALTSKGLEIKSFSEFVSEADFEIVMLETDVIIAPTTAETIFRGNSEFYGETKVSGAVGDTIKFAKPALVSKASRMAADFDSSVECYSSSEELAAMIRNIFQIGVLETRKRNAIENSRKYALENALHRVEEPFRRR